MIREFKSLHLLGGAVLLVASASASGQELFPAGAESKTAGIQSSLHSTSAPAVLYNPANISVMGTKTSEPYIEMGFVNVNYNYEHPDFDPVVVKVASPITSAGFSKRIGKVNMGGIIFPTKNSETRIPGLPRSIGGDLMEVLDVENEDTVYDIAAGANYQLNDSFSFGASGIRTFETHKQVAKSIADGTEYFQTEYNNEFSRFVLGTTYSYKNMVKASLAYKTAVEKRYKGKQIYLTEETGPKKVDYVPETINLGVMGKIKAFSLSAEVSREQWEKGKSIVKSALEAEEHTADLSNTTQLSTTAGYDVKGFGTATIGYASIKSPWGEGNNDAEAYTYGVDYGQLNALDKQVFAVGGSGKVQNLDLGLSVSHANGDREVSAEGDNVGYYSLDVTTISGSLKTNF